MVLLALASAANRSRARLAVMSSEEDSAEGPDRTFLRAKAKRARQRVDAGEPRASNNNSSLGGPAGSPFLRSPPALRNGFMSSPKALDDLLEAAEEAEARPSNGDATPHLLRDILQARRDDDEEEDDEEEDVEDEMPSADPASSMDCVTARASEDEDETGNSVRTSGGSSTGAADAKKARVENIVSNMLLGPSRPGPGGNGGTDALSTTVNGCKKRKLYQPQQANRAASGDDEEDGLDDSFDEEPLAKQRRIDREAFRRDLLRLQTQVATMQRRYEEMRSDEEDLASEDSIADDVSADAPRSSPLRDVKPPARPVTPPPVTEAREDRDVKRPPAETRQTCIVRPQTTMDVERLVAALKSEMTQILPRVIDGIVSRFTDRRPEARSPAAVPKDQSLLTQMLDSKSPRGVSGPKVIDRGRLNGHAQAPLNAASLRSSPCEASRTLFPGGSPYKAASFQQASGDLPEQTEAMSLVVPAKKKRHKVTDTRLTPRDSPKCGEAPGFPPPPLVPVSLPTSVAIPNPSLHHHADVFSFHVDHPRLYDEDGHPGGHHPSGHHPPPLPLMLTHSPDSLHYPPLHPPLPPPPPPPAARHQQENDSDNGDSQGYDSGMAMISFLKYINGGGAGGGGSARGTPPGPLARDSSSQSTGSDSPGGYKGSSMSGSLGGGPGGYTSTLTPMHLRKAKLMFFYVRYPSSAILKMYFPDINFNKNNTAQLVKWFSNFREFYYIQMEKYARQSVSEGVKNVEDLKVSADSELLRVLNLHYNRNNHIEVPENFRYVVEQTLREFFRAIVAGKDQEQSWKKAIYKVIARLDDNVPEYFKSPNFLEQLE